MWIVVNEEFQRSADRAGGSRALIGQAGTSSSSSMREGRAEAARGERFFEEALTRFFETPRDPKPPPEALAELYKRYQPKTIALSIDGRRGVTRSLTRASYDFLAEAMGPEAKARFMSAEPLIVEYCDTRLPAEMAVYRQMVSLTAELARRALSSEVIRPGTTTVGELRRWLYDQAWAGVTPGSSSTSGAAEGWRRRRRASSPSPTRRGGAAGDLLHVDFG